VELNKRRRKFGDEKRLARVKEAKRESAKEAAMNDIIEIVREASYQLLVAKEMKRIKATRNLVMTSKMFHNTLLEFGIKLDQRSEKLLEQRYLMEEPRGVDYVRFKEEFLMLGSEVFVERRKEDAMKEFMRKLAHESNTDTTIDGSDNKHWSYTGNTGDIILTDDYMGTIRDATEISPQNKLPSLGQLSRSKPPG
jgi:hypothetical protein